MNIDRNKHNKYVVGWKPPIQSTEGSTDQSTAQQTTQQVIIVGGGGGSTGGTGLTEEQLSKLESIETGAQVNQEAFSYYQLSDGTTTIIQAARLEKDTANLSIVGDNSIHSQLVCEPKLPETEITSTGTNAGVYKISYQKTVTQVEVPATEEGQEPTITEQTTWPLTITYISGEQLQQEQIDTLRLYYNDTEKIITNYVVTTNDTGITVITCEEEGLQFDTIKLTKTTTPEATEEVPNPQPIIADILVFNVLVYNYCTIYLTADLDQYWKLDDNGNLYTTYNAYSTQELSAYGIGDTGGTPTTGALYLYELKDIDKNTATTPINNGILQYNSTTHLWEVTDGSDIKPDLTGYATQEWATDQINNAINILKGSAPENMDTLGEIAGIVSSLSDKVTSLEVLLEWFEWDDTNSAIKALFNLYGVGEISAYGYRTGEEQEYASYLRDLKDVDLTGLMNDGILQYNATTQMWEVSDGSDLKPDLSGYATESWVTVQIADAVSSIKGIPPTELDTLQELAAAIDNDPQFYTRIESLEQLLDWFSFVDGRIRANYDLWSVGEVSAYGYSDQEQTTVNYLKDLKDVNVENAVSGQILVYNGSIWVSQDIPDTGLNEEQLAEYLTNNNYIQNTDLADYATQQWTNNQIQNSITALIGTAPDDLDTLGEIADQIVILQQLLDWFSFVDGKIRANYDLWGVGEITAYGVGEPSVITGTLNDLSDVTITSVQNGQILQYDSSTQQWINVALPETGLNEEELASYLTQNNYLQEGDITWSNLSGKPDTFNTTINQINDLNSSWDSVLKNQIPNWLTTVSLSTITDLHSSWDSILSNAPSVYVTRWPSFSEVTNKPTTLAGYGITDAYTKTETDNRYVNISGDTMTGNLTLPALIANDYVRIGSARLEYDSSNNVLMLTDNSGGTMNFAASGEVSAYGVGDDVTIITNLNDLSDVSITNATNGQVLMYQNGVWVNGTAIGSVQSITVNSTNYTPVSGIVTLPDYITRSSVDSDGTQVISTNIRLKDNSNYGSILYFGDSNYAYISEPTDDDLTIHCNDLNFDVDRLLLNGEEIKFGGDVTVNTGTTDRLAYYSSSTTIDDYSSTIGSSTRLWYLNSGIPTNSSSTIGASTTPVYLSSGIITACTYNLRSNVSPGTAGKLAYYSAATNIEDYTSTIGSATRPVYINAGVPTQVSYSISATINSGTSGKLAYYSGANAIDDYTSTIGSSTKLWYLNAGVPTNSSSTVGDNYSPVWLSSGTITKCSQDFLVDRGAYKYTTTGTNWNNLLTPGMYFAATEGNLANETGSPGNCYGYGTLVVFGAGNSSYGGARTQMYFTHGTDGFFRTTYSASSSRWHAWSRFITNNNIGSYALTPSNYTSTLDSRYVNVSGDTMTGTLTVTALSSSNSAGVQTDTYGNIQHKTNSSSNSWQIKNSSGSAQVTVNASTGLVEIANNINVGGTTNTALLRVSKSNALSWNDTNYLTLANAALYFTEKTIPANNYCHPIITWRDTVSGYGYITNYTIGSTRYSSWGSMRLAVSNDDWAGSEGAYISISGSGSITMGSTLTVESSATATSFYSTSSNFSLGNSSGSNGRIVSENNILYIQAPINGKNMYICGNSVSTGNQLTINFSNVTFNNGQVTFNTKQTVHNYGILTSTLQVNQNITAKGGIVLDYYSGTWLSMCTRTDDAIYSNNLTSASGAHAMMRIRANNGNYLVFGGLGNYVGFYFFTNSNVTSSNNIYTNRMYWGTSGVTMEGNFVATGEVTAYSSSDIRLKTNIKPLKGIDAVRQMNVVQYDWTDEALELKANKEKHSYGLIAQELEQIVPEVITHNMFSKGYLGIDYQKLVPFALSAIKEVDDEVIALKKRVKNLENRLSKYESIN